VYSTVSHYHDQHHHLEFFPVLMCNSSPDFSL